MISFTGITRHAILILVILLYLGQVMLPILFVRLPGLFSSYLFYNAVLMGTMLLLYPGSFLNRNLSWFYLFVIIHLLFRLIVWGGRTSGFAFSYSYRDFIQTYLPLFLAMLVFWHYVSTGDTKTLGRISAIAYVFIFIGILNNLLIFIRYPNAMNIFTGQRTSTQHQSFIGMIGAMGFLGYGFFNGLTSLFPTVVYMLRSGAKSLTNKILWFVYILLFMITVPRTNTTAFVLFTLIFGIAAWFMGQNYKRDLIRVLVLILVVIMIPNSFIASIFYKSSEFFPESKIGERLYDAGVTIEDPYIDYYNSTEHTGRRLGRIPLLWKSFLSNPLFGGEFFTGHVAWFDLLSVYGLVGFIPWFLLVYQNNRKTNRILPIEFKPHYLLSIMSFVAMGSIKNTGGTYVWTIWFLILPGSAFIYNSHSKPVLNRTIKQY